MGTVPVVTVLAENRRTGRQRPDARAQLLDLHATLKECVVVVQRAASSVMHGSPRPLSARSTVLLNAFDRLRTLGLLE